MSYEKEFENKVRGLIRESIEKCTPKQQAFFKRLHPMGLEKIPWDRMKLAYTQCRATEVKNNE